MQTVFSPDVETFSTPPTTPTVPDHDIRPSLSRRSSRPSSLRIQQNAQEWKPHIIVEESNGLISPASVLPPSAYTSSSANGVSGAKNPTPSTATQRIFTNGLHTPMNGEHTLNGVGSPGRGVPLSSPNTLAPISPNPLAQVTSPQLPRTPRTHVQPMSSPCFVHSRLQDPSLNRWLDNQTQAEPQDARVGSVGRPVAGYPNGTGSITPSGSGNVEGYGFWHDEEGSAGSVTKQLAETAVGVREMSKQLGRTRVHSVIQSVLIVTKARDNRLIKLTRELALYLMLKPRKSGRGMVVYVDSQLKSSRRFDAAGIEKDHPDLFVPFPRRRSSSSSSLASDVTNFTSASESMPEGQLRYWTAEMCSQRPDLFDFVITLGGDGTVLFTSWLFQRIVPPVLPFALGSLGFLTNFDFLDHQAVMDNLIDSGIRVNLRMRFTCTVYRAVAPEDAKSRRRAVKKGDTGEILMKNLDQGGWEALEGGFAGSSNTKGDGSRDKEIMCFTTRPVESFEVLNDLVVDRGPSPYVSLLELFGDEHHLTTVQADGLTISTPTGSTAYSLSAGGSLVHPEIPAILITPICPHTLSFRPMLLPDSMELRICVPFNSRSTAWASFDGRGRVELKQGDHIKVTASKYPFPTVCADSQSTDWFHSISRTLKWNERERQKSFVVVEEGPSKRTKKHHEKPHGLRSSKHEQVEEKEEEPEDDHPEDEEDEVSDEEEEEEEKFDIDDLSSTSESSPKSSTSAASAEAGIQTHWEDLGREKAEEIAAESSSSNNTLRRTHQAQTQAEVAARTLMGISNRPRRKSKSGRSRSRSRPGVETPDRFAGPHPHPPRLSPRHMQFLSNSSSSSSINSGAIAQAVDREAAVRSWENGARDDIHSPRNGGTRSRIPRERDRDAELNPGAAREPELTTPTGAANTTVEAGVGRRRHESKSPHRRVAFAVWGHDESDSATSDSDA
ncbi:ATP-NAD kinase [Cristinia sonorae]|uniref:ATP-NAD kinase n=1 Tax=Cristinia sonorae TaxID=1940300 RepID=A0A8K0UK48_9AGAR|nr:ATP-NAD kinase [Cristinia sonorae]